MRAGRACFLGIDVGSSRTKAVLVDAASRSDIGAAAVATPFATSGGRTEATVDSLVAAVGAVLGRLDDGARRRVVGVGIAGVAESGAPFDAAGRALAPVIAWHDRRGEDVAEGLAARFGAELHRAIGQRLRYVATVAKLGWLVGDGLAVADVSRWLGVPEIGLRALTGAEATEWSLAGRTGCFDLDRRDWLPDVAEAAGFDVGLFPPVMGAGSVMGRVTQEAAAWSGLAPGTPVTVAGHDHLVGFVGCGAGAGDLADSVGTAETVTARAAARPDADRSLAAGVAVGLFPGGDGWAVMTSAARAGQALESAAAALGRTPADLDRLVESAAADLGRTPADLDRLVQRRPSGGPAAEPDAALVDSLRRREPPALPPGDPATAWGALLDALAAETADAVDRVTGVVGPRSRVVVFGGGAAGGPGLAARSRRIHVPVVRSDVAEAVARGAACFGAVAAGLPLP